MGTYHRAITQFVPSLVLLTCAPALAAETPPLKDTFTMNAYMRLGFNTALDPFKEASDTQGFGPPSSRHVARPNYFWLRLTRTLENGLEAGVKFDNEAQALPHETGHWSGAEGDAELHALRVRDLYAQFSLSDSARIWAGDRALEFEDVRLFDYLNHFNINAHGVGGTWGSTTMVASFAKDTPKTPLRDASGHTLVDTSGETLTGEAARKNTTVLFRHEHTLSATMALKPMVTWRHYGSADKDTHIEDAAHPTARTRDAVKGADDFSAGLLLSRWGDWGWANTQVWVQRDQIDKTGNTAGQNQTLALSDSSSLNFGSWAMLTGLLIETVSFNDSQKTYKISSGALVDDATTKSATRVVAGVQPVLFVTDRWHAALDLQTTYKSHKTAATDFDQTLVTPILRYSLDRSAMGLPHLYTSLTWGHYDWKAKRAADGSKTDTLVTTQTGFECLF